MQYRQRWLLVFNLCDKGKFFSNTKTNTCKNKKQKPHPALLEAMHCWDEDEFNNNKILTKMKKMIILSVIFLKIINITTIDAQLKINSLGKAIIGPDRSSDDANNVLSASIFGKGGDYRYGAKLAFGDFGRFENSGWNVFIGEFGDFDSDELWLHGRNGIRWTNGGQANSIICRSYYESNTYKFRFYVPAYTQSGILVASDLRFKTNIQKIDDPLIKLKKLEGVTYNLLTNNQIDLKLNKETDTSKLNEKELKELKKEIKTNDKRKIGFIAQELQAIFPELVEESEGYMYIDYIGLIPVVIEALKEQQTIIDAQSLKIKELESKIENGENKNSKQKSMEVISGIEQSENTINAFLYQNIPNPFNTETEIKYYVPLGSENVKLYIFNLQGKLLKTETINTTGQGSLKIKASELKAGIYIYTLLINGQEVDTKRMILTN